MTLRGLLFSLTAAVTLLATVTGGVQPAAAQATLPGQFAPLDGQEGQGPLPNRLAGEVGITEALGATVPTDLTFVNEAGETVRLADVLGRERPLVVAFVYHNCPMLCSLVLDGLSEAVAASDLQVGRDYDVLAVSVDPQDTPARAAEVKARYVRQIGEGAVEGLHFWTVTEETEGNVQRLAEALGFRYAYDVRTGEYAHSAALMFLSPEGTVTRYLYGISHAPRDFRLAVVEAGEGTVGSSLDQFLLTCFEYDEDAQSYSLAILTATKIGGGALLLALGALLFTLWRREARGPSDRWDDAVSGDAPPAPAPGRTPGARRADLAEMMMQTPPAADAAAAIAEGRQAFWTGENGVWLPPAESTTAPQIDALFNFIMVSSIILTLFVAAAMVYFVVKYRRRSHADRPVDVHESKWLEVSWIVIPTLLVLVVFFWGFRAYVGTYNPPTDAITVNVKAQKWAWAFEYQNGIQTFGEVYVPVGTPIRLEMTSQDVLHSFYVPEFRIKHDVLPNRFTYVWFEAPREGVYQVLCTEYCGTAHSNMGAKIRVVSRQQYYSVLRGELGGEPVAPAVLGEQLYTQRNCNTCHSVDGAAGVGPTWLGSWGQPRPGSESGVVDEAYIVQSIIAPQAYITPGFEGQNMPSYDGQLNEEQLAGLAAYIRLINGAATAADTTLAEDAGQEASVEGQPPEGGMGDPSVPVADPVRTPEGSQEVREE